MLRTIAGHPATRVVLLLAAAVQALLGAFIVGLSVNIGSALWGSDPVTTTTTSAVTTTAAPRAPAEVPSRGPDVRFSLPTRDVTLPGPDSTIRSFTIAGDGTVWFTWASSPNGGDRIGRLAPDGRITGFRIPTASANAYGIVVGPDGNVWFAEQGAARIGRMTPAGAFTEFPLGTPAYPTGIAAGPDGNLWFTVPTPDGADWIGRITPSGAIARFPLAGRHTGPREITAGPDGNLWFSMGGGVGRITPQGVVTEHRAALTGLAPEGITVGPGRAIWFATYSPDVENVVGRTLDVGERVIVAGLVRLPAGAGLHGIVTGPDGNVWVAQGLAHAIARITPDGQVRHFDLAPDRFPNGLRIAPDGTIWCSFSSSSGVAGFARFNAQG